MKILKANAYTVVIWRKYFNEKEWDDRHGALSEKNDMNIILHSRGKVVKCKKKKETKLQKISAECDIIDKHYPCRQLLKGKT